jgi:hypothetical protein
MGNSRTEKKDRGDAGLFVSENKETGRFIAADASMNVAPGTNVRVAGTAHNGKITSYGGEVTQNVGNGGQLGVAHTKYTQGGSSSTTTYSQAVSNNSSLFVTHNKPSQGSPTTQIGYRMTF